jgi:hypothetical protein
MDRRIAVVLYVVAMAAIIVGVDFVFFRNRFWERLISEYWHSLGVRSFLLEIPYASMIAMDRPGGRIKKHDVCFWRLAHFVRYPARAARILLRRLMKISNRVCFLVSLSLSLSLSILTWMLPNVGIAPQQNKQVRIGLIAFSRSDLRTDLERSLIEGLRKRGYGEG